MKRKADTSTGGLKEEIANLKYQLTRAQERLLELADGEVDAELPQGAKSPPGPAQTDAAVLNALPGHIAVIDRDGVILSVNEGWKRFATGKELDLLFSGPGQNYVELCERAQEKGDADARAAAAGIRAILSGASTREFLLEYPCHSPAEERWFLLRVTPIGTDGPGGAVIMHVNITEEKKRENATRQSDERFRSMFITSSTGMAISTPHGRYLDVNASYCRMLGYTREELLARDFASLTHPEDLPVNLRLRDELLAGRRESFVMEKRYLKKNGDTVWTRHSVSATHTDRGEIATLMAVAEDISERKSKEEALAASEQQYRLLIGTLPAAVYTCDAQGRITLFNDAAAKLWGRAPEIGYDQWSGAWRLYASDGAPLQLVDSPMALAIRQERSIRGVELIIERSDGSQSHVLTQVDPIRDSGGLIAGAVNVLFDLTERRRSEAAPRQSGEELRALARRIEFIREEQMVRIARELHDVLGQALTMLKLHVLSLQRQLKQHTGESTTIASREALELIQGALRNVRELCAELRPPVLDHLGLGPAIETLAARFQTHSGIACVVSGADDLPAMEMQGQIAAYRIVQELLTNVARHSGATEARIALRLDGSKIEIEVADNGRGIRASEITGIRSLGLVGMRERALAAGGSIVVEARPCGGTIGTARLSIFPAGRTT